MNQELRSQLISIARENTPSGDPAHDFQHILRVLKNAELIAVSENADLDVVIPAALFHDIVMYRKDDPRSKMASEESAAVARDVLEALAGYPKIKIEFVCSAISTCSFSKGIAPVFLEAKILQDADGLESIGAISVMRTFSSTGQMNRPFYNPEDPFCENRDPEVEKYALDLFFSRLLLVQSRLHTDLAKKMGARRSLFLRAFLAEFKSELDAV